MDVNEKLWEEDGDFASDHNSRRNSPPGPRRRCPCRSVDVLVLLKGRGLLGSPAGVTGSTASRSYERERVKTH